MKLPERTEWLARYLTTRVVEGCNPRPESWLLALGRKQLACFDVYGEQGAEAAKAALALAVLKGWLVVYVPNDPKWGTPRWPPGETRYHGGVGIGPVDVVP